MSSTGMGSTGVSPDAPQTMPDVGTVDLKLEVVTLPVTDVDRAKGFCRASDGGWTPTS